MIIRQAAHTALKRKLCYRHGPIPALHIPLVTLLQAHHSPSKRAFSSTPTPQTSSLDYDHAIIGGGAVGLAIARALQTAHPNSRTILIERHGASGTETSSRNSQVIHAGLYYGADTLKTDLCIRGRHLLYAYCAKHRIDHRNCGKWIVAQDQPQMERLGALENTIRTFASYEDVPLRFLSRNEVETREPEVRAAAGALESSSTGIVDAHAYMGAMENEFVEAGGDVAVGTEVGRIEPLGSGGDGSEGYRIFANGVSGEAEGAEENAVTAAVLINSAGLMAVPLSNRLVAEDHPHRRTAYYAKGTYYAYNAPSPRPSTLVYPAPTPGLGGLGTHYTYDLAGNCNFGPDVRYVDDPYDLAPDDVGLEEARDHIAEFLPSIIKEKIRPVYCGMRPKLSGKGEGAADFLIERTGVKEHDSNGTFVNLLGIESPGLTASLAIGERVEGLLYRNTQNFVNMKNVPKVEED